MSRIDSFEAMLRNGQDSPLLRYSLGREYLQAGDPRRAVEHLREAVDQDPKYSAAWKELGHALQQSDDLQGAAEAWRQGMAVAEDAGDVQAAKEMRVFLRRLEGGRP